MSPLPTILCVDLDGTLVGTDTLWESLLQILLRRPGALLPILFSLRHGKARFKSTVAGRFALNAPGLPYRLDLLKYLEAEKSGGRRLVLVTGAHQSVADAVQTHLRLFDVVLGTNGDLNLSGRAKGETLAKMFGKSGFSYAGNSEADLMVWPFADAAIPVNAPAWVIRRIGIRTETTFPPRNPGALRTLLRALRVHQWVKNLLALVPLFTSGDFSLGSIAKGLWIVLALSLTASAQYILNDLIDLDTDRKHHSKKKRAIASGNLPIPAAILLIPSLLCGTILISLFDRSPTMLLLMAAYFGSSLIYTVYLKTKPLIDVFTLAALYAFRIVIGGQLTAHPVTSWLLTFSCFWFLSFGFLKRFIEVSRVEGTGGTVGRRGYHAGESLVLMTMGQCSGFCAAVMLALYVDSEAANRLYAHPAALWAFVPIGLLIHCRLWLSGSRGHIEEDPVHYFIFDRVMWACGALGVAAYLTAIGISVR